MEQFENEELLWEPETGGENIALPQEEEKEEQEALFSGRVAELQDIVEKKIDDFEIPEIPTVFPEPKESAPVKVAESEPVWDLQTAKQKLKETKQRYRLEKRRQRCGRALWITGLLCALLGGVLGAVLTWLIMTM